MNKNNTALVLINIGSPNELSVKGVKTYLRRFLMDPQVIQIPFILRFFLFYVVICNIRAPRSYLKYQSIWTPEGSPLLYFAEKFRLAIEGKLEIRVINAMMYSEPGFATAVQQLKAAAVSKVIVAPMYPQHADSSYKSAVESAKKYFAEFDIKILAPFFDQNFFINSIYENVAKFNPDYQSFEHVIFSYHGLPQTHLARAAIGQNYRDQCLKTTELVAEKLAIKNLTTCFQSRVGVTKWVEPYLDQTCEKLALSGIKNILVISPSFVVDGLETLQEISDLEKDLKQRFEIKLTLVPGLNSESHWVNGFSEFIQKTFLS